MPRIEDNARDEHFWHAIAQRYDVAAGPINLENGYFGRMTREVAQDYQRNIDFINRHNSVPVRQHFDTTQGLEIRDSLDTVRLLESGQVPLALGYAALSVFGGLLATWAGLSLTKL